MTAPTDSSPLIVNLAPTGAVADAVRNPHVPITEDAIAEVVAAGARWGVSMVHLHVRDGTGSPSCDSNRFRRLIQDIRARPEGRELVVCATTSGRHGQTPEERATVLDLEGAAKPDMASLTLSSLNFLTGASVNPPDTIRFLARRMLERGIRPELEVFDLGMINFAKVLIREGLIRPPYYFNLLLGNVAGAQPSLTEIAALVAVLPEDSIWSLAGIGRFQQSAIGLGCVCAPGVRIGLEDNLWMYGSGGREPADNGDLLAWLNGLARAYGRALATPSEVRQRLGLCV